MGKDLAQHLKDFSQTHVAMILRDSVNDDEDSLVTHGPFSSKEAVAEPLSQPLPPVIPLQLVSDEDNDGWQQVQQPMSSMHSPLNLVLSSDDIDIDEAILSLEDIDVPPPPPPPENMMNISQPNSEHVAM